MREKKRVGNQEGECRRRLSPARISLAYSRDGSRIQHGTLPVVRSFAVYPVLFVVNTVRRKISKSLERGRATTDRGIRSSKPRTVDTCRG